MNKQIVKLVRGIENASFELKVKAIEAYVNDKMQKAYYRWLKEGRK